MGFSPEWEQRYAENTHLSVWPWSDLVSLVYRHCKAIIAQGRGRVLELGCGAGANIPLFRSLGMDYYAIEGSPTITKQLHIRYPDLADQIVVGDFTLVQPFPVDFDLVVDRGSLTANCSSSIVGALRLVKASLKSNGVFIGSDFFSTNHSDSLAGVQCDDQYTRTEIKEGHLAGTGKVHFSDERHLRELFSDFKVVFLEEKVTRRYEPVDGHQFASWNIVARKPHV
jgi:SAM-dependent methyltransferase